MRTYLQRFFADFEYTERDARELLAAYDAICADDACRAEWEAILSVYDETMDCNFKELCARAEALAPAIKRHKFTVKLLLYICLSRRTQLYYRERNLSEALWRGSMIDLRYKLEECREVWGICGTFVKDWFDGFFNLKRYTLGRLQFEVVPLHQDYERDGKRLQKGDPVINVHIPRTGTPLDATSCNGAFTLAARFFEKELKGCPPAFVCHSWLLYPINRTLLPERSNIRAFMERFDVCSSLDYGNDHPDLWRLFDRPYTGDPDKLPYDTSVRRAYVDHIKAGGKTGEGSGIFFYE